MWVFDSSNALSKALRRKKTKQIKLLLPISDDEDCRGNLVSCPRRLFPVFDCYKNPNTGTFICEAHLRLADKDKRICDNEAYTRPKTVRHRHLLILPSLLECYFAQQNHLWASVTTSPAHRHTPKHSFICLTSAQGHNQPTPRVQTLTAMNS